MTYLDDAAYRSDIKVQRNLIEGRHDLGRVVFHGHKGEIYQLYHVGTEEQFGALGLVLNCIVLWITEYCGLAVAALRAQGRHVEDEALAHISPAHSENVNFFGTIDVDIGSELAKLDGPGYRPLREVGPMS